MSRSILPLAPVVGALLAAACATVAPPSFPPGTSMTEVEARMGKPGAIVQAPGGVVVWQYPTGPVGQTTYMVDFGPDQRAKAAYQALTVLQFAKLRPGITREEVRLLLGPPGETMTFARMNELVWSYRYQASASENRIFNVHFDAQTGYVRTTSDQFDPLLNPWDMSASNT
jgi:hypothetical protein